MTCVPQMQFNLPRRWYGAKTNLETERLFALTGGLPKLHGWLVSLRSALCESCGRYQTAPRAYARSLVHTNGASASISAPAVNSSFLAKISSSFVEFAEPHTAVGRGALLHRLIALGPKTFRVCKSCLLRQ